MTREKDREGGQKEKNNRARQRRTHKIMDYRSKLYE